MKQDSKNILERLLSETGQFGILNTFLQTKTGLRLPPSVKSHLFYPNVPNTCCLLQLTVYIEACQFINSLR